MEILLALLLLLWFIGMATPRSPKRGHWDNKDDRKD